MLYHKQWRSQPKLWGGPKNLVGTKVHDVRRITLFCLYLGGMAALALPWLRPSSQVLLAN